MAQYFCSIGATSISLIIRAPDCRTSDEREESNDCEESGVKGLFEITAGFAAAFACDFVEGHKILIARSGDAPVFMAISSRLKIGAEPVSSNSPWNRMASQGFEDERIRPRH